MIFLKKVLSVKITNDLEIGRQISDKDRLLFASFNEGMFQRLTEIASKVGHYDWLEPEDED